MYKVNVNILSHNKKRYARDTEIELDEKTAKRFLKYGYVEEILEESIDDVQDEKELDDGQDGEEPDDSQDDEFITKLEDLTKSDINRMKTEELIDLLVHLDIEDELKTNKEKSEAIINKLFASDNE